MAEKSKGLAGKSVPSTGPDGDSPEDVSLLGTLLSVEAGFSSGKRTYKGLREITIIIREEESQMENYRKRENKLKW